MEIPKKSGPAKQPVEGKNDYTEEIKKMDEFARQRMGSSQPPFSRPVSIGIPVKPHDSGAPSRPAGNQAPKPSTETLDLSAIQDTVSTVGKLAGSLAVNGLKRLNEVLGGISAASASSPYGAHDGYHGCGCGCHSGHGYHHGHHGHGYHHGCAPAIGNYNCCEPGVYGC